MSQLQLPAKRAVFGLLMNIYDLKNAEDVRRLWKNVLRIDVRVDPQTIVDTWRDYRVLMFREPAADEDVLLIGCGNNRINIYQRNPQFAHEHQHVGAYTIDSDQLELNPSMMANFGEQPIASIFGGKRFKKIFLETSIELLDYGYGATYLLQDLSELLHPQGVVVVATDSVSPDFRVGETVLSAVQEDGVLGEIYNGRIVTFDRIVYTYGDIQQLLQDPKPLIHPDFVDEKY
jgi:hypothetical protein